MDYEQITTELGDGVLTITLNRPTASTRGRRRWAGS